MRQGAALGSTVMVDNPLELVTLDATLRAKIKGAVGPAGARPGSRWALAGAGVPLFASTWSSSGHGQMARQRTTGTTTSMLLTMLGPTAAISLPL